ncbi:MAG: prolyl oligopeptidase family serine peptidase [Hyphomonadaceae bacterium]
MKTAIAALVFLAAACASAPAVDPSPVTRHTLRADGSRIEWTMTGRDASAKQGVLMLSQGSGCGPAATNPNLSRWRALAPGFVSVTVEKYGVLASDPALATAGVGQMDNCPAEHVKNHRLYARAQDFANVVAELRKETWWSGELVIMGGSEGGAVMSVLAPMLPDVDAVVIMSTGLGLPLSQMILDGMPPPARAQVEPMFAAIRSNPDAAPMFSGLSAHYYAEFFDKVLAQDMLQASAPILLIQGETDTSAPVAAGRATRDIFAAAGHGNLTYWEKPGWDHIMTDRAGVNHVEEVITDAAAWVAEKLAR